MTFKEMEQKEAILTAEKHWAQLHNMPETAFKEYETTAYIKKACEDYPVKLIDIGMETGAVYYLDAGREETVALRADIDALLTEQGAKHLCGHDAHASTLLGAMHYLCSVKEELPYNVLFVFQPAEEGTRGAKAMLDHGLLDKVPQKPVRMFGIHNRPEVDCGDVVVHRGPLMSEKNIYSVTYTVNSIKAGEPDIPVPKDAVITGYFRSYDHKTHLHMQDRLVRLAESIAEAYECGCELKSTHAVPALVNHDDMYEIALRAAESEVGAEHVTDSRPCLASEDFAVFGEEIPSFFYWVGSGTPGKRCAPWHDPGFCIDPDYMKTAVPLLCASATTR